MCGICGFVAIDTQSGLGREHLQRMTDALIHRGPDEEGMYVLGRDAARRGLWNPGFVQWMPDEHQAGRHDFGRRLWSFLVFEVWARLYFDGVPARTPPGALTVFV